MQQRVPRNSSRHQIKDYGVGLLASLVEGGAKFFLTNDARLPAIPGLKILVLDELTD